MKSRRKLVLAPLGAITVLLAFASVAYACTFVAGTTKITNIQHKPGSPCATGSTTCATPGDVITAEGSQTVANRPFLLHFLNYESQQDGMNTCMGDLSQGGQDEPIGGPSLSDGQGNIPATKGVIPPASSTSTTLGPALVCFITPGYGVATDDAPLEIVGL